MSKPKRHHTTPCLILRNFADANEHFFVFDKRRAMHGVVRDSIYNRFVRKHQNSLKRNDGSRDYALEHYFTHLETQAAPVITQILQAVRAKKAPKLAPAEKKIWDRFLIAQWTRTPTRRAATYNEEDFERLLYELLDTFHARHGYPVSPEERARLTSRPKVIEMRRYAMFEGLQLPLRGAENVLESKGLGFLVNYAPRKSLVIGDNTVLKMVPKHTNNLSDPEVEMWFPIAHDVLITPLGSKGTEEVFALNDQKIRQVNEIIFRESNIVASRSMRLLESLSRGYRMNNVDGDLHWTEEPSQRPVSASG